MLGDNRIMAPISNDNLRDAGLRFELTDEGAFLRPRGIDPRIGGFDIDAFGKRLDPGTEAGHSDVIAAETASGSRSTRKGATCRE